MSAGGAGARRPHGGGDPGHHLQRGARHGIEAPRGLAATPSAGGARFTTMFPFLPRRDPGEDAIEALVTQMQATSEQPDVHDNGAIPAGFTYLGQFVDHDITFDASSKIDGRNDPAALVNFRSPRFDLDSLYGSGPADQPFLYDWDCGSCSGAKLLVGHNPGDRRLGGDEQPASVDLPRNAQERAIIGDPRNDEHLIISQLHLLFIKFHNRVVEHVHDRDGSTDNELFDEAHRTVRWHYQWIVMHDFLRRIAGDAVWQSLQPRLGEQPAPPAADGHAPGWKPQPSIPVEFSAAAYRFGHSMVRPVYILSDNRFAHIFHDDRRPDDPDLGGFRRLPAALEIDWRRFFGRSAGPSRRIDHQLTPALFALPPDGAALARLNLRRGRALALPSGVDVARAMGEPPLDADELLGGGFWPARRRSRERDAILRAPPLWLYVLREALTRCEPPDVAGSHLGPVGGRIVAEVLIGLLEADPGSYLHDRPQWKPTLPPRPGTFEMTDLLTFTLPAAGTPES